MISINSANFGFLKADSPQLVRLGALAEHYFQDDPNTCLIKLRQFGELLAQTTAASAGLTFQTLLSSQSHNSTTP
jgi:type I restriction enzyme R subunit